jgi:2-keto-4-pentenoate hydratase/2-oxohepta-3-ene-1,7-dioic acid hydratase in catechol pathway
MGETALKLATFMQGDGPARIGLVDTRAQTILDLQAAHQAASGAAHPALASMLDLIDSGAAGLDLVRSLESGARVAPIPLSSVRLLSPVPEPRQVRDFSCFEIHLRGAPAGMNVLKARMAGGKVPALDSFDMAVPQIYRDQPIWYLSNRFSVVGPETDVEWPPYCDYLDFELEFGIFIGKTGKNIPLAQARDHIFGYCIFNDVSARDQQGREMAGYMGPTKGKSFDTGNVIGPWIVTRDEIGDIAGRAASVRVNGETWASSTTSNMMHSFEDMIAFVTVSETVHAGEFFGSGTIGGCCGLEMDRWIKPGDVVELEIEGLGVLRNRMIKR